VTREITPGLRNIITKMLEKDPNKRITLKELKENEWINENRKPLSEEL
jgi:serine/threonine protein kinase